MKIAVLGATGASGLQVISLALAQGHEVTAVVRTPSKITIEHEKLKVVQGNIWKEESLKECITGHDAVISCLGKNSGWWFEQCTIYVESTRSIIGSMKAAGVDRFMCMSTWCANGEKGPKKLSWFIAPFFLKKMLEDMNNMEQLLVENGADINYTVVKPPILDDGDVTEKEIIAQEGQKVKGKGYGNIRRSDVARFMLSCLEDKSWDRKLVSISY